MARATCRKRPCRVCGRWFLPDVRLKDRQKTCALPDCKGQWHRKQCTKWNRTNQDYFKGIYLQKKLTRCSDSCCPCVANGCNSQPQSQQLPASRIQLKLPRSDIAELITAKGLIVVDYIVEQLLGRRQGACRWPVSIQSAAGRDKSLSGF